MRPHEGGVRRLNFELTNRCNAHCVFCPRDEFMKRIPLRDMTLEEYTSTLNDILKHFDPYLINFGVFGEPTLSPILPDAIRYASERGLETRISTNASLLDIDLADRLLRAGLTHIHLSVDEIDPKRFNEIRRGLDFNVVLRNVKNLWNMIKIGGYKTKVYIYPVVCSENRDRIKRIISFWKQYSHSCHPSPEIPVGPNHRAKPWVLNKFQKLWMRLALALFPNWQLTPHCYDWLVVRSNGDVVPCCLDAFHEHVFGNAFRQPILEVWHSPAAEEFRDRVERGDLPPLCQRCRFKVFFT